MVRRLLYLVLLVATVAAGYVLLRQDDAVPEPDPTPVTAPDAEQPTATLSGDPAGARTAIAGAATKTRTAVANSTVEGRVADAVTAAPLPGATVTVSPADVPAAVARTRDGAGASGVAGPDGAYAVPFPHHDDGQHWVRATHEGYLPCIRLLAEQDLAAARRARGFDCALLPLGHGARVIGRVTDVHGTALAGVRIAATGSANAARPEHGWRFESEQSTDADGRFAVGQIPPGTLRLAVAHPGFTPLDQSVADLTPGSLTSVGTLVLQAAATPEAKTAALHGTVTDADARAVAGAKVALSGTWVKAAAVDGDGAYRIAGIPPQALTVTITAPGQPEFTFERAFAPGEDVVFDHRFAAGGHFVGGVVVDGAEPLEGLEVSCRVASTAGGVAGKSVWRTVTDAKGTFRLQGLPDQPVDLLLEWPWSRGVYRDLLVRGLAVDRDDHRLRFGVPRPVAILGTVRATDGAPIAGAVVAPEAGSARGAGARARATSGPDGAYRVELALTNQQSVTLQATKRSYATAARFFVLGEVTPDRTIAWDVALAREDELATIAGRVTDAAGKPVAGARCEAHRTGAGVRAEPLDVTATDGSYRKAGVAPGTLTISIEHAAHARFTQDVVLAPGARATVDAVLEPSVHADLQLVLAGAGGPAAAEDVTVVCRHPPRIERATTDAQGTLALPRWPIAATTLVVAATRAHAELHAEVPAEQLRSGTLRLTVRGGTGVVQGTLRGRDGHPVVAELITLRAKATDGLGAFEEVWTDQEGRFRIAGLADGVYVVGVAMSPRTVEVRPGAAPLALVFP